MRRGNGVKASDLVPAVQEQATLGGGIAALPSEAGVSLVYYNADLIEEAGLKAPDKGWRWGQEFLEIARRVSRDGPPETVRHGVEHVNSGWWGNQWYTAVWAHGGDLLSRDHRQCALAEPKAVEGLHFVADLTHKWRVTATADARQTAPQGRPFFETGAPGPAPRGPLLLRPDQGAPALPLGGAADAPRPGRQQGGAQRVVDRDRQGDPHARPGLGLHLPLPAAGHLRRVPAHRELDPADQGGRAPRWWRTPRTGRSSPGPPWAARSVPMIPQFDDVLKALNDGLKPVFDSGEKSAQVAVQDLCRQVTPLLA